MARPSARRPAFSAAPPRACLRLLGGFRLEVDGAWTEPAAGVQRLLAFLAIRQQPVQRGYAAACLWLDVPDERAAANLRSTLWRLRKLGDWIVVARNGSLRLHPNVLVDVQQAAAAARRWLAGGMNDDDLRTGSGAFETDLLPDWYDEWVVAERERQRQLRLHALEAISDRYLAEGRLGDALVAALSAVAADPLRETAHRALIRVHLAEGNTGEAIRQVRQCEQLLHDELGVFPSARLTELVAGVVGLS